MKSNESEANQNSPTLDDMILRQISDLRTRILNYDVISEVKPTNADQLDLNKLPNHADILIFGPSGSGKSSLVLPPVTCYFSKIFPRDDVIEVCDN